MRSVFLPMAVATSVAALLVQPVYAQRRAGPNPQQIRQLQPALDSAARAAGFGGISGEGGSGVLADDSSHSWESSSTFAAGAEIAVVGVCGEGCSDLNLRVFASNGTKVGEDVGPGSRPVVRFTAAAAGRYRVAVEMAACSPGPCAWGIKLLSRSVTGH